MIRKKTFRLLAAGAALAVAPSLQASDWRGPETGAEGTEVSIDANWTGNAVPGDNMRFDSVPGRTVTFDGMYAIGSYMWVGSATPGTYFVPPANGQAETFNPVVWRATGPDHGLTMTGDRFLIADAGNQNGALQIESGTYVLHRTANIGIQGGAGKLVVNGGLVDMRDDFIMADNSASRSYVVVGSGDPSRTAKITVPNNKWAKLTQEDYGFGELTLKAGGEFHCGFLQINSADSTVVFDGGKFVKSGDVNNTVGALLGRNQNEYKFAVNPGSKMAVTANGGTLDVGYSATRIDVPVVLADGAESGTLRLCGNVRLTLNGAGGFAGTLSVASGCVLEMPAGTEIGGLEIDDGAMVLLASEADIAEGQTLLTVGADVSALAGKFVCKGMKTEVVADNGKWLVRAVAYGADETPETFWLASLSSDNWNDAANWSAGVPASGNCATLLTPVHVRLTGSVYCGKVAVGRGCVLKIHKNTNDWPNFRAEEIRGPGKLVLSACGLKPVAGTTLKLYADVSTDDAVLGPNQDCWIEGNDDASRLELYGTITADRQGVRVNQAMDVYGKIVFAKALDNDNYIQNSTVKSGGVIETLAESEGQVRGEGELRSGMLYEDGAKIIVNGWLRLAANTTFSGNLTGTGEVSILTPCHLSGNNEAFAGTVTKTQNRDPLYFDSETAGSPLATWILRGDLETPLASGTLKFGQIDYAQHPNQNWHVFYIRGDQSGGETVTVEIGHKGGNSNLGSAAGICKFGADENVASGRGRLRKVGTGNLDLWFDLYREIDIHEGVATFRNNNGPFDAYTFTGGAMRLAYVPNWGFLDRIKNSTHPIAIDTDGADLIFLNWGNTNHGAIGDTNVGGFAKLGAGTLVCFVGMAYTGPTLVKGGTLQIRAGNYGGDTVAVDEGAMLTLMGNGIAFTDGEPVTVLNGTIGEDSLGRVQISGVDKSFAIGAGDNCVTATSSPAGNAPNRWVAANDNWTTTENWSRGTPQPGQTLQFEHSARIANMAGYIDLDRILVAAGVEVVFVTKNYGTHPNLNVGAVETIGEGESVIGLDHVGLQSLSNARLEIPETVNIRPVATDTDSWLRNVNLRGKLLGNGILRPYGVNFHGDNSRFAGEIVVLDAGSRICDVAAGATNAVWRFEADVNFDVVEGVFKMGAFYLKNQRAWYSASESTATIEVGHKNIDFGCTEGAYMFFSATFDADADVPNITFRKVGTGKWDWSGKGIRSIVVESGELALHPYVATGDGYDKFDNRKGNQIDSIEVWSGAKLGGSKGTQPIYSLTLKEGAILKNTVTQTVTGEGEEAVTEKTIGECPLISGPVAIEGDGVLALVEEVGGENLIEPQMQIPLLETSGAPISGKVAIHPNAPLPELPDSNRRWAVSNRGTRLLLRAGNTGFTILIR